MAKTTEKTIVLKPISTKRVTVTISGDSDLILNKMNDINARTLIDKQKNKQKTVKEPNEWEAIITAMHWRDGKPTDYSEQGLKDALENNAPCITTFGLKKSFEQAVVRNNIDKYSTKFQNSVNIIAPSGLVPITFAKHTVVEKLIAAKKGSPVLSRQNVFAGWSATFDIQFVDGGEYSLDQILQIIGLAGFGGGIGSGRSSGYGRYHIEGVTA